MSLAFRQVHLDFHTSECIDEIGADFSKENFQEMLKLGHVNSITVFSKCHHGWSYHPTKVNQMHPGLSFDLLKAQIEAAHEIGVKTPVYISAGFDEKSAVEHPEWWVVTVDEAGISHESMFTPHYHLLCLNSPYLEELLAEITEVCENYDADGIFLDILGEHECHCTYCRQSMQKRGMDYTDRAQVRAFGREVYATYTRRVRETIDAVKPGLPVFHNGGHIPHGQRDKAFANTHLELESLPTGGWGYDHFPMSAAYARTLGLDFLGMTGKFHTWWGEFGGFKHKNALRYEAALSLANGAKCSVGDQLHPRGAMNETTYRLIGAAYAELEQKEAWGVDATHITDIAVLSAEATTDVRNHPGNVGAVRMLLEGHYLFNIVDAEGDFAPYKVLILPDAITVTPELKIKLDTFTENGGKLLATGDSCIDNGRMLYELGCTYVAPSEYCPAYVVPTVPLKNMDPGTYVVYGKGHKVTATGTELAKREQSYFNRAINHFCSHQHTPNSGKTEGSAVTVGTQGAYISWKICEEYATMGSLIVKDLFQKTLDTLLGDRKTLTTNLPVQGVTTLTEQTAEHRYVNHLLYACTVKRGNGIEVIEEILPVYNTTVSLRLEKPIKRVYLAPSGKEIPFTQENGTVAYTVEEFENHQMVVLDY